MIRTEIYNTPNLPPNSLKPLVIDFLFDNLEEYGDAKEDIGKAYDYALLNNESCGGLIMAAYKDDEILGAAIVNKTGMEGYIPENILVYIATHKQHRGGGIGKILMKEIIENAEGNIALHVEKDNPAIHLYKKFGFTNKYLEMRLNKKETTNGIRNA